MQLYKHHHRDVLRRGIPNQSLFEAYTQYCFAPKHTVGEQLLTVRRDKREREAFSRQESRSNQDGNGEAHLDPEPEDRYKLAVGY